MSLSLDPVEEATIPLGSSDDEDNGFREEEEIYELNPQPKPYSLPQPQPQQPPAELECSPDSKRPCMTIEYHLYSATEQKSTESHKVQEALRAQRPKKRLKAISLVASAYRLKKVFHPVTSSGHISTNKPVKNSPIDPLIIAATQTSSGIGNERELERKNKNQFGGAENQYWKDQRENQLRENVTATGSRKNLAKQSDPNWQWSPTERRRNLNEKPENVTRTAPGPRRQIPKTAKESDPNWQRSPTERRRNLNEKPENVTRTAPGPRKNLASESDPNWQRSQTERRRNLNDKREGKREDKLEDKREGKREDKREGKREGKLEDKREGKRESKNEDKRESKSEVNGAGSIVGRHSSSARRSSSSAGTNASISVKHLRFNDGNQKDSKQSGKAVRNANDQPGDERTNQRSKNLPKLDTSRQVERKRRQSEENKDGPVSVKRRSQNIEYEVRPESVKQRRQNIPSTHEPAKRHRKSLDISENQSDHEPGKRNRLSRQFSKQNPQPNTTKIIRSQAAIHSMQRKGEKKKKKSGETEAIILPGKTYKEQKLNLDRKISENFGYHLPEHGDLPKKKKKNLRKLIKYEEKLCVNVNQDDYFENLYKRTTASYRAKVDKENAQRDVYPNNGNGHRGSKNDRNVNKQETSRKVMATAKQLSQQSVLTELDNQTKSLSALSIAQRAPEEFLDDRGKGAAIQRLPRKANTREARWRKEQQTGSSLAWDTPIVMTPKTSATQTNALDLRKYHTTANIRTTENDADRNKYSSEAKSSQQGTARTRRNPSDQSIPYAQYLALQEKRKRRLRSPPGTRGVRYTDESSRRSHSRSRSKSSGSRHLISDPIRLHQYYESQWKRFRNNIPGETTHAALRRAIHIKLLMDM